MLRCENLLSLLLKLFVSILLVKPTSSEPAIRLNHGGSVKGQKMVSQNGTPYYSYTAIPYAKPPVGSLRFQDPEQHDGWTGERDATDPGPLCLQFDSVRGGNFVGEEDCLVLNVYTPTIPDVKASETANLPVLAWIHGGGFVLGSANRLVYDPSYLMDRPVVLVTFNYRLNIFGFLSTEDEVAPGNYGLKDQAEALRWIQKNIVRFGGDPTKVTIFGESAGAASVHFQVLSPSSKGLFRAAIALSGSAVSHWAVEESLRENALRLADMVHCPNTSSQALVSCLKGKPAAALIATMKNFIEYSIFPLSFAPRVDKESSNPFLADAPIDIMLKGSFSRVPLITGFNKDEGLFLDYLARWDKSDKLFEDFEQNWTTKWCPLLLDVKKTSDNPREVCIKIKKRYFGPNGQINRKSVWSLTRLFGERSFNHPARIFYELHSKYAPTYVYSFEYTEGKNGYLNIIRLLRNLLTAEIPRGTCHADDIVYFFKIGPEIKPDTQDFKIKEHFLDLLTGFASDLHPPVTEWPIWSLEEPFHWIIDKHPRLGENLVSNHLVAFWESLEIKENIPTERTQGKEEL